MILNIALTQQKYFRHSSTFLFQVNLTISYTVDSSCLMNSRDQNLSKKKSEISVNEPMPNVTITERSFNNNPVKSEKIKKTLLQQ